MGSIYPLCGDTPQRPLAKEPRPSRAEDRPWCVTCPPPLGRAGRAIPLPSPGHPLATPASPAGRGWMRKASSPERRSTVTEKPLFASQAERNAETVRLNAFARAAPKSFNAMWLATSRVVS